MNEISVIFLVLYHKLNLNILNT